MRELSDRERELLARVVPGVAAALRPPLNDMHIAAQRMLERQEDDSVERAVFQKSYFRMLRLMGNLELVQELMSDEPFYTQDEELKVLLDEVCRQASSIAWEAGVTVRFVCAERYVLTAVNWPYLERLMWNLLNNAIKFTPKDGVITVTLEVRDRQVLLRVDDTGCGIPSERIDTLFDGWCDGRSTGLPVHGVGLGLPICRRIAEGHGGRLMLESRPGKGTHVTVSLPLMHSDNEPREYPLDYAGGFSHVMLELSDALPCQAFFRRHLD